MSFGQKMSRTDYGLILILVIGVVLAVVSLFRGILEDRGLEVEYLNEDLTVNNEAKIKILVDIEGAVIFPGVYELSVGDRIKDVLVKAGGYSESADRKYCEKNLNLAQPIVDGQKIYIPFIDDTYTARGYAEAKNDDKQVNVNTASREELDTLWGVGKMRVESIVKNRPYTSLEDWLKRGGVTQAIWEKNRDRLIY